MWFSAALFALLAAAALLIHYAERGINILVLVTVGFSWALGFSYFLFMPFDIEHAMCLTCEKVKAANHQPPDDCRCLPSPGIESLVTIIPYAYLITMLLGYLMNDAIREFINSGEFTTRGRIKDALWSALYFYVPALVIGLCFVVYLLSSGDFQARATPRAPDAAHAAAAPHLPHTALRSPAASP